MKSKKERVLDKAEKVLGREAIASMQSAQSDSLERVILDALKETEVAKEELNNNPNYIKIRDDKKLLESGLREVRQINNLKIELASVLLSERGQ